MNKKLIIALITIFIIAIVFIFNLDYLSESLVGEDWECGDQLVDNRDGTMYSTTEIGDQCWMSSNLEHDNNQCTENEFEQGDWCGFYDNDTGAGAHYLYQWEAATGACPEGWKLPSDKDYKRLEMSLGVREKEIDKMMSFRGRFDQVSSALVNRSYPEIKIADSRRFGESGFNVRFSGVRHLDGSFDNFGKAVNFWTSTEYNSNVIARGIRKDNFGILRFHHEPKFGASVRCIKK